MSYDYARDSVLTATTESGTPMFRGTAKTAYAKANLLLQQLEQDTKDRGWEATTCPNNPNMIVLSTPSYGAAVAVPNARTPR